MAVLLETSLGEIVIDLYIRETPILCANFLKLCQTNFYNGSCFHSVEKNFIAKTGLNPAYGNADTPGLDSGDVSALTLVQRNNPRAFKALSEGESLFWDPQTFDPTTGLFREHYHPKLRHDKKGTVSMANTKPNAIGSAFFITLRDSIVYLDNVRSIIGCVSEGLDVVDKLNATFVEDTVSFAPLKPILIRRTVILDDPFPDPKGLPKAADAPPTETEAGNVVVPDDAEAELDLELVTLEKLAQSEAKSRAVALEILGDVPDAQLKPPDNILFVCKLNPLTEAEDLKLIFSRFGRIVSCEIIRDWKTGDSLQYAFIEFEDAKACEMAYFKMEGCLIDDKRIHVDFCQSVARQWKAFQAHGAFQRPNEPDDHDFRFKSSRPRPRDIPSSPFNQDRPRVREARKSRSPDERRGHGVAERPRRQADDHRRRRASPRGSPPRSKNPSSSPRSEYRHHRAPEDRHRKRSRSPQRRIRDRSR